MSSFPGSVTALIVGLFWPDDPTTQTAILLLLALAAVIAAAIYLPLLLRLFQIGQLQRAVQACFDDEDSNAIQRQEVGNAFSESPLAYQWSDFVRRWQNAIAADPIQNASLPELSRAPVRLIDVLHEHPLVPAGPRRSLLPALPAIFLSAGLLGAFAGLVLALPGIGSSLGAASDAGGRSQQILSLMDHLGMALRIGLWGLLLSLGAAITGRFIEGRADGLAESLDSWVQLAYGAISAGELTTRTAHEQRATLARLQEDLGEVLRLASGRPRPLIRSTAPIPGGGRPAAEPADPQAIQRAVEAAGQRLVEQMGDRLVAQIGEQLVAQVGERPIEQLGERLEGRLSAQLADLREELAAGIPDREGQPGPPEELALAVSQLARSAEAQDAARRALTDTARTVSDAAEELRSGLDELANTMTGMREAGAALGLAAQRLEGGQSTPSGLVEALREGLEELTRPLEDRLESALASLRESLADLQLGTGGALPALDEAEVAEKGTGRDEAPDPTPDELLDETRVPTLPEQPLEEVAEPERPASSSEVDTIPSMPAPTREMIYAARSDDASPPTSHPSVPAASAPGADDRRGRGSEGAEATRGTPGGTLSGLLRATHHSGPSSSWPDPDPDGGDFDPNATLILRRADSTERLSLDDAPDPRPDSGDSPRAEEEDSPDDGESRRRGFFGRRK